MLAGVGYGAWRFTHRAAGGGEESGGLDARHIAVLYLEKAPGTSDSVSYLADGLTEALIHELSRVKGLQVISSNGVLPYKGAESRPPRHREGTERRYGGTGQHRPVR